MEDTHQDSSIIGATCLYAVYDPASRRCTLTCAGHPMPVIIGPDGDVDFVDLPSGMPPGLGGMPLETDELELAEGSQLVLYTDDLIEDRHRDIDSGPDQLRTVLACASRAVEDTCEAVLDALLPTRPSDDVVLLVAKLTARWKPAKPPTARSSGPNSHCSDDSRPTLVSMIHGSCPRLRDPARTSAFPPHGRPGDRMQRDPLRPWFAFPAT